MKRRNATTLIEILVAIFIMSIGLLAILVLFPLGAMRMAQAIQDDRCMAVARQAEGVALARNIRNDPAFFLSPSMDPWNGVYQPVPVPFPINVTSPNAQFICDPDGPSFPIFVDPIGFHSMTSLSPFQTRLAGATRLTPAPANYCAIQRRSVGFVQGEFFLGGFASPGGAARGRVAGLRWFTLLDDINFNKDDGRPKQIVAGNANRAANIEREGRYSYAYMLQRPLAKDPDVVQMQVVVFNKRSLGMAGTSIAGLPSINLNETFFPDVAYDTNRNVVIINHSPPQTAPNVRSGDWVLDSTMYAPRPGSPARTAHANFYRVVKVSQVNATQTELEVQQPLRGFVGSNILQSSSGVYIGAAAAGSVDRCSAVVMEGIAEVFDKGVGWRAPPGGLGATVADF